MVIRPAVDVALPHPGRDEECRHSHAQAIDPDGGIRGRGAFERLILQHQHNHVLELARQAHDLSYAAATFSASFSAVSSAFATSRITLATF